MTALEEYTPMGSVKMSAVLKSSAPLFLVFCFFRFYVANPALYLSITALSTAYGIILFTLCLSKKNFEISILFITIIFLLCGILTFFADHNPVSSSILSFFSHLGFAWSLISTRISKRITRNLTVLLIVFFLFHAVSGVNPEDIFTVSRNYISVIMVLSLSFYIFACQQDNKTPSFILLSMAMAVFLWAIGRAGIASGAFILIGSFLIHGKIRVFWLLLGTTALICYLFFLDAFINIDVFTVGIDRFERLSTDGLRDFINNEYLNSAFSSIPNMLFGAPLKDVTIIQEVGGNPHNSLISLHAAFGLLGFVSFYIAWTAALVRLTYFRQYYVVLMLLVAVFRSLFDSTAFHGQMDVVIFYGIFLSVKYRTLRPIREGEE